MYAENDVKQDPESHCLAQRTMFPAKGEKAWRVFRQDGVSHLVAEQDVAHWTDLAPVT